MSLGKFGALRKSPLRRFWLDEPPLKNKRGEKTIEEKNRSAINREIVQQLIEVEKERKYGKRMIGIMKTLTCYVE
jgi:hypothetical protein